MVAPVVVGVRKSPGRVAVDSPGHFSAHPATDLDAHIGARHVVESCPVEAADLHVLDRSGLYGKISCLPRRYRNQTGRGAEEEAFHHLHFEPPFVAVGGFRLAGWLRPPAKVPWSPIPARFFRPEITGRVDLGFPPPSHRHLSPPVPPRNE